MRPLDVGEPTVIGPYRLLGRLGSGGMGRVYLGRSAGGRTVAVKVVHPQFALDDQFRARFRREVKAARKVGGHWTAPVLDADPDAPVPWVATGYVAGPSLAQAVAVRDGATGTGGKPLPDSTVRVLGASLAEALAHVHSLGLVHRDVKPSNVLLTMDGPRLIDFGIARATDGTASLTSTGVSVGSPGYMAPEQFMNTAVTGAADIFSLGAVLAFATTGRPPFPGDSAAALLYRVAHEEPELDGLHGELRDIVTACLAKDPKDRPSPEELAHRLAPEGAARAVAAGWLPAELVAEVGRSAVRLLDLEADTAAPGSSPASGTPAASAPSAAGSPASSGSGSAAAPGSSKSAPGAPAAEASASSAAASPGPSAPPASQASSASVSPVAGVFGPPDPSFGGGGPAAGGGPTSGRQSAVPGPRESSEAYERTAVPKAPRAGKEAGGRLSVSLSAASERSEGGPGRRLSCTVALAVAGALAVVALGVGFVFDLLPGGKDGDKVAGQPSGGRASQPGDGTTGEPSASPSTGIVPASYLGTWKGQVSAAGIPAGTFELVVRQGKVGAPFATLTQTDLIGGVCKDVLTLKRTEKNVIVATGKGVRGNPVHCAVRPHTIYLRPVGDDLQYTSDDPDAGDPKATLSKMD